MTEHPANANLKIRQPSLTLTLLTITALLLTGLQCAQTGEPPVHDPFSKSAESLFKKGSDKEDQGRREKFSGKRDQALQSFREAKEYYDKAFDLDPKYAPALRKKAVILIWLGTLREQEETSSAFQEAVVHLDAVLKLDPSPDKETVIKTWSNKGWALSNQHKYKKAIEHYEEAIDLYEKAFEPGMKSRWIQWPWFGKGYALTELAKQQTQEEAQKSYEKAIESFDEAINASDGENVDAWNGKGYALTELAKQQKRKKAQKSYKKAVESFDEAIDESDGENVDAWNGKGVALIELGRLQKKEKAIESYEDAIESFEEVRKIDPNNVDARNNKGVALTGLGWLQEKEKAAESYEDAIESLDKALEIDPNNVDAWNNKGIVANSLGRYEYAIVCFERASELRLDFKQAEYNKQVAKDNLKRFSKTTEKGPDYTEGWDLLRSGEYREAIEYFNESLRDKPNNVDALYGEGRALVELAKQQKRGEAQKNYENAITCFEKALKIDPDNIAVLNGKGQALVKLAKQQTQEEAQKSYENAITCFKKALQINQNNVYAWNNKGVAHTELGMLQEKEKAIESYEKAIESFGRAIGESGGENVDAWNGNGWALVELAKQQKREEAQKNYENAIESFDKAINASDGKNVAAWNGKGVAYTELGRLQEKKEATESYDDAIESLEEALRIERDNVNAWNNKGVALCMLGRHMDALQSYEKALSINKDNVDALHNKVVALCNLGRCAEAIECFDKLPSNRRDSTKAQMQEGMVLIELARQQRYSGEQELALKSVEQAIDNFEKITENINKKNPRPETNDAVSVKAWNYKGVAFVKSGMLKEAIDKNISASDDYNEAIKCYDKALDIDQNNFDLLYNKGVALIKLDRHIEAELVLTKVMKIVNETEHDNAFYLNRCGALHLDLKNYKEAEQQYKKARTNGGTWQTYLGLAKVSVKRADEYGSKWHYRMALRHLNRLVVTGIPDKREDNLDYYLLRGYVHAKLGEWEKAQWYYAQSNGHPNADIPEIIERIRIHLDKKAPTKIRILGLGIAIVSLIFLVAIIVLYICNFKVESGKNKERLIGTNVFTVLVPTLILFSIVGFLLPYITQLTLPGGTEIRIEISELKIPSRLIEAGMESDSSTSITSTSGSSSSGSRTTHPSWHLQRFSDQFSQPPQ